MRKKTKKNAINRSFSVEVIKDVPLRLNKKKSFRELLAARLEIFSLFENEKHLPTLDISSLLSPF